jgi:hypothetical protein
MWAFASLDFVDHKNYVGFFLLFLMCNVANHFACVQALYLHIFLFLMSIILIRSLFFYNFFADFIFHSFLSFFNCKYSCNGDSYSVSSGVVIEIFL